MGARPPAHAPTSPVARAGLRGAPRPRARAATGKPRRTAGAARALATGPPARSVQQVAVQVELPRRDQTGVAVLLDVENGRKMIVSYLHGEDMDAAAFDQVVSSLSYPADIIDVASANPDFSTLVAAVQAAAV